MREHSGGERLVGRECAVACWRNLQRRDVIGRNRFRCLLAPWGRCAMDHFGSANNRSDLSNGTFGLRQVHRRLLGSSRHRRPGALHLSWSQVACVGRTDGSGRQDGRSSDRRRARRTLLPCSDLPFSGGRTGRVTVDSNTFHLAHSPESLRQQAHVPHCAPERERSSDLSRSVGVHDVARYLVGNGYEVVREMEHLPKHLDRLLWAIGRHQRFDGRTAAHSSVRSPSAFGS